MKRRFPLVRHPVPSLRVAGESHYFYKLFLKMRQNYTKCCDKEMTIHTHFKGMENIKGDYVNMFFNFQISIGIKYQWSPLLAVTLVSSTVGEVKVGLLSKAPALHVKLQLSTHQKCKYIRTMQLY